MENLGHENRDDAEVQAEKAEREQRERRRDELTKRIDVLVKSAKQDTEQINKLAEELSSIEQDDLRRVQRLQEVSKEFDELCRIINTTGKISAEQKRRLA